MLARLLRGSEGQEVAQRLQSEEPLTEAQFTALFERLVAAAEAAQEQRSSHPCQAEKMITALAEAGDALSPVIFRALDADGSGALEGNELLHLRRLASHIQSALPPGIWISGREEAAATAG